MSLKQKAVNLLSHLLRRLSLKKIILLESYPDFTDNTLAVFEEMLRRGYAEKYSLVWELGSRDTDTAPYSPYCKDFIIRDYHSVSERVKHFYYTAAASLFVSSNRFLHLQSTDGSQRYLHLAHGCALKKTGHYYIPGELKNAKILTLSEFFFPYDSVNLGCREEQLLPLGYPRCDELMRANADIHTVFPGNDFRKVIYWLPTYRQHKSGKYVHSSIAFPILYNAEIAAGVNEVAEKQGVLLLVKPHPAQDLSVIKSLDLSHLKFIDNDFLKQHGISNYALLGSADALLTDYSSVYYDYLLCNKPIGLCFDDYEEYVKNEGFTVDPDFILSGGERLYNAEDLCAFIQRVAAGEDIRCEERQKKLSLVHKYRDGNTSKRVVDYIEENML